MNRHNTPLRYPGGKQRLAPFVIEVLRLNRLAGGHYVEPYAGGAGVAIHLLLTKQVQHIHLNDSSPAIYAFWRSVQRKPDDFCRKIAAASLTVEEWRRQRNILKNPRQFSQLDLGFSLFFLNRCNRSGIPNGGLIGGLGQQGRWKMDARFPRNELIRRIEAIAANRKQMTITNLDAEAFIRSCVPQLPRRTLVYCDPPYFHQSDRLYLNYYKPSDHVRLASTIQRHLKRPWLVSYDNVLEIRKCYGRRRCVFCKVQYNAARVYTGTEIFFVSDGLRLPDKLAGSGPVAAARVSSDTL
ncbi:MAG: DNA adenine methylase [Acidobacteriia bacterium]|nr:DNA adenine methylase [Terriglobia bacterium]